MNEEKIGINDRLKASAWKELGKLEEGDEVIVPANTYIASILAVSRAGLKPVFVDVAENSFHPSAEQYAHAVTTKTRALLLVHLFGIPNDMDAITAVCQDSLIRILCISAVYFSVLVVCGDHNFHWSAYNEYFPLL